MSVLSFVPKAIVSNATLAQTLSQESWITSAVHINHFDEREGILNPNVSYVEVIFKSGDTCRIDADSSGCEVTGGMEKSRKLLIEFFDKRGYRSS